MLSLVHNLIDCIFLTIMDIELLTKGLFNLLLVYYLVMETMMGINMRLSVLVEKVLFLCI